MGWCHRTCSDAVLLSPCQPKKNAQSAELAKFSSGNCQLSIKGKKNPLQFVGSFFFFFFFFWRRTWKEIGRKELCEDMSGLLKAPNPTKEVSRCSKERGGLSGRVKGCFWREERVKKRRSFHPLQIAFHSEKHEPKRPHLGPNSHWVQWDLSLRKQQNKGGNLGRLFFLPCFSFFPFQFPFLSSSYLEGGRQFWGVGRERSQFSRE